jgi:AraC-like DNA-binding protein
MKTSAMSPESRFRYLPVLAEQRQWGLFLTDCGYTAIDPGTPYPPCGHPDSYASNWEKGRTLDEYQVIYITRGRGTFETHLSGRHTIEAGDVFVLFPGVWHRYMPDPETGWDEQWVGFNGEQTTRPMLAPFFNPKKPVLRIGVDEALRQRFIALVNRVGQDPAGAPFSNAGEILVILGLIQERARSVGTKGRVSGIIREAQNHILMNATATIDFAHLASALGIGYSTFRHSFKQQTGISPAQFQNSIRINRAQDLLSSTDLSVSEIAAQTGFDTVFYFSRHFKKSTGLTPKTYRARSRIP